MSYNRLTGGIKYYGQRASAALKELFDHVTCRFPSYSGLEAAAITPDGRIFNVGNSGDIMDISQLAHELLSNVLYTIRQSNHPANRGIKKGYERPPKSNGDSTGAGTHSIKNHKGKWLGKRK